MKPYNIRDFIVYAIFVIIAIAAIPQIRYYYTMTAARAKADAALLEARGEVARANGLAQANNIIGESLTGKEEYLRYLFINTLKDSTSERIYIATEAGMPILEAKSKN